MREKLTKINDLLFRHYGELSCPLRHETPFQLLCAVMLSAQCRDDRVNEVTKELFRQYPAPAAMARADVDNVAELIKTLGLFRNKSRNLVAAARMLCENFAGEVPHTLAELITLPGIGRKSANVILGNAFGIPGFPVDTHVMRLSRRFFSELPPDPVRIERALTAVCPPEKWSNLSHMLIQYGRDCCRAIKPECEKCLLRALCAAPGKSPEKMAKHGEHYGK